MKKSKSERILENGKSFENNLCVLMRSDQQLSTIQDNGAVELVKHFYDAAKKDGGSSYFALASLVKAIVTQKKLFFGITLQCTKDLIARDPDNTNKKLNKWSKVIGFIAKQGIHQLWDSTGRKSGGFVVTDSDILSYLKLTKTEIKTQLNELKAFTKNTTFDDSLVIDECGELRVEVEKVREKIEEGRVKSEEKIVEKLEFSSSVVQDVNESPGEANNLHSPLSVPPSVSETLRLFVERLKKQTEGANFQDTSDWQERCLLPNIESINILLPTLKFAEYRSLLSEFENQVVKSDSLSIKSWHKWIDSAFKASLDEWLKANGNFCFREVKPSFKRPVKPQNAEAGSQSEGGGNV